MTVDKLAPTFEEHARGHNLSGTRLVCVLIAALVPSGFVLDLIVAPEHVSRFLIYRLAAAVIGLAALSLTYRPWARRHVYALGLVPTLATAAVLELMVVDLGADSSSYYAGLTQLILGIAVLLYWRLREILLAAGLILAIWLVPAAVVVDFSDPAAFGNNLYSLAVFLCIAVAGTWTRRRSLRREYTAQAALSETTGDLSTALTQLKELDTAKSRFFANVTHELRTPLTLMLAPLEAILDDPSMPAGSRRHKLEVCRQNGMRLLRLVDDLLSLSRVEAGRLRLRDERVDLGSLAATVVGEMQPWAEQKGIRLELADEIDDQAEIRADPEQIDRVLLNLIGNALKFTEAGYIRVRLAETDDGIQVEVSDSGIGIPQDQLPQVFERFHQVDTSSTRQFGGTGIGLALTREIVELHGGIIEAESTLGRGTTIRFWLPYESRLAPDAVERRRMPPSAVAVDRRAEQRGLAEWHDSLRTRVDYRLAGIAGRGPAALDEQSRPPLPVPRVLIVEDNPDMIDLLSSLLSGEYAVVAAADGEAGLSIATEQRPDIILSDVMMPVMNGFELLERLRQDERTAEIPVALLTARGEVDDRVRGREIGADAYLTKPFQPKELRATLRSLLKAHDRHVEAARDERDEAMRVLAAGVAHEVLNPLGFIRSALVALREAAEELRGALADAGRSKGVAGELDRLFRSGEEGVRRVRTAAAELQRFAQGSQPHPPQPTSLCTVVDNVLALVGSEKMRDATETDLRATRMISARPGQIEQVVLNLMINAFQAGGTETTIALRSANEGEGVVLAVRDTGPGIPRDKLEEIFNPFYTTQAPGKGTGLGLSVSRQVVREHGGSLTVESEIGRGTTFYVRLPAASAELRPAEDGT